MSATGMNESLIQYYRCPESLVRFALAGPLSAESGYFRFGDEAICYGTYYGRQPAATPGQTLYDALCDVAIEDGRIYLPFDPSQVASNLRAETYASDWRSHGVTSALVKLYYLVRPVLSVGVRRHLQRFHLNGWDKLPFPRWPVDCSIDSLNEQLLILLLKASGAKRIPFIWFWPDGHSSCAIMTHDVETDVGRDFCATLMDCNDRFGIKASFQVVPEQRYDVTREFLDSIRERGFEVLVHDLNHDGHLYRDRNEFLRRVAKINSYAKKYGAEGFRAGVLYRKQIWFDALDFAYDMSVPNVAHLDPQRGGCCTVMPYFLGKILEVPVTTTQDYTLFNILGDYSIDLWKRQIALIMKRHGLISFIVHPDYLIGARELEVYEKLLGYLDHLKKASRLWMATPGEVNRWWRLRARMTLIENGNGWQIDGPGKERACVAYATLKDGQLAFDLTTEKTTEVRSLY